MAPSQPARKAFDDFGSNYNKVAAKIVKDVNAQIAKGIAPEIAVAATWNKYGIETKLESWILDGAVFAITKGLQADVKTKATKSLLLSQVWDKSGMTLSDQIHKLSNGMQDTIASTIRDQMRRNKAWSSTAKAIDDLKLTTGDISQTIKDLDKYARLSFADDPIAKQQYIKTLRKTRTQVQKLAASDANPRRLRKAYQAVITATEKGSIKALDRALNRAVKAKARYNAERVARTEIAKAYGNGFINRLHEDEDAVGYRSELSNMHIIQDICDYHAEADMYGMGPGVYPIDQGPPYPYHPGCLCVLSPVYKSKTETPIYNEKAGKTYLEKIPASKRRDLLGKAGSKQFGENPDKWDSFLNNWQGHEAKSPILPQDIQK